MADADAGKGGLGLLVKDPQFRQKIDDTLTQVNHLVIGINEGHGTLGKLRDRRYAAHKHEQSSDEQLRSCVSTIRQNPKKYLTIHLKIF